MATDKDDLRRRFHDEMLRIYDEAKDKCPGYKGSRFIQMVRREGGFETAKRLLVNPDIQDGFTDLALCECLHLTAEHLILEPEFETLFSDGERAVARERLGR